MIYYTPSISVIVSTYNRPQSLHRLLGILNDQRCVHLKNSIDVCVVDDGSEHDQTRIFPEYRFNFEYIYRPRGEGARVYSGRNLAAQRTRGEYILQLDDDLEFHPYLLNMLQSMAGMATDEDWGWMPRVSDNKDKDFKGYEDFSRGKDGLWRDGKVQWMICNWQATSSAGFFMPRKTWDKLDGYDEQFDGCMGAADQELALRVQKLGAKPNDVKLYLAPYFIHVADEETGSWRMKMIDGRKSGRERNEDILARKHPDREEWLNIW